MKNKIKKKAAINRTRMDSALSKLTRCFLKFGSAADKNIGIITRTAGEILNSACVVYNRLEGDSLCTISDWQAPPDMPRRDKAKGHICFDVISGAKNKVLIVRNLDKSAYAGTDPNVKKYNLKTYIGYPVKAAGKTIGSLCAVFQTDTEVAPDKIKMLSILARALGVEEQRNLAENRLKESEDKYSSIINVSPDIIYTADLDGRLTYISRQAREYGYSPNELIGRHIIEFIHSDDRYLVSQAFDKAVKTGTTLPMICYRLKKKDGSYFHAEQKNGVITRDGRPFMLSGIIRDATERDQLRSRVEENEETLRKIFDTVEDAIFIKDVNSVYIKANRFCAGLFGLTPRQLEGKSDSDVMPEELALKLKDQDRQVIKTGGSLVSDSEIQTAKGEIRTFNSVKTPLYDPQGRVSGLLGVSRDMTEFKKLQEQVIESKAVEAAGKITRPAAHDFNNILATITGYAALIMETLKTGDPAKPEIEQILNAVKRAAAITNRLQTYGSGAVKKTGNNL